MKPEIKITSHKEAFDATSIKADTLYENAELSINYYHLNKGNSLQVAMTNPDGSLDIDSMMKELSFIILSGSVDFMIEGVKYEAVRGDTFNLSKASSFGIYSKEDNTSLICVAPLVNDNDDQFDELLKDVKKVEEKDMYTKGHNDRVGKYSQMIMQVMNPDYHSKDIFFIGATHDIGKVNIPIEILNKPGKLDSEEWEIMKTHPIHSYDILKSKVGEKRARFARWHHERLDGSGYPDGLKGDEIPLESRIMAVADVFDAITSKRSYRDKMELDLAFGILDDEVERNHLDQKCVETLKELVKSGNLDISSEQDLTDKYLK